MNLFIILDPEYFTKQQTSDHQGGSLYGTQKPRTARDRQDFYPEIPSSYLMDFFKSSYYINL